MTDIAISHSEIKTWARCRRQWYLGYYRGFRQKQETPTGVTHVGGHIHLALEGYHGYNLDPIRLLRWSYEDVIRQQPDHEAQLRKDLDLAIAMVEGYVQWSMETGLDVDLDVVSTEHEISHPVRLPIAGDTITWRGKLDVLFRQASTGKYQLRDYKTVGSFEKASLLLLDTQMRFYAMLLAFAYPDARDRATDVLYLMIKRSKRTARATPPFYEQAAVAYNRHDLNATYLRSLAASEEIVAARHALDGNAPSHGGKHQYTCYPNPSDFCSWGCPFLKVCHMADDGSRFEDALAADYEVGNPYKYYDDSRIRRAVQELT